MTRWLQSCMAIIIALFILNTMPGLQGLKDVQIIVQKYVRRGADVHLSCHYDLEKEILYAVKWYYKGPSPFKEFYRYLPAEVPPALVFNMPGVYVDMSLSNDHDVVLKNASLQTSGIYKCLVVAEFPFETKENLTEIRVVVFGDDSPVLRMNQSKYHPGDLVAAECYNPPTFPAANITWYINDVKDHGRVLKTETRKDTIDPLTKATISTILLPLPGKIVPIRIYCRATIFSVYDQKSNTTIIRPTPRRLTGTETLLHSGSTRASPVPFLVISVFLGLLCFKLTCKNICSTDFEV